MEAVALTNELVTIHQQHQLELARVREAVITTHTLHIASF